MVLAVQKSCTGLVSSNGEPLLPVILIVRGRYIVYRFFVCPSKYFCQWRDWRYPQGPLDGGSATSLAVAERDCDASCHKIFCKITRGLFEMTLLSRECIHKSVLIFHCNYLSGTVSEIFSTTYGMTLKYGLWVVHSH